MPEVISLISSTPPPPASSVKRFHSSPPVPAGPPSIPFLSDDFDFTQFTYDDDYLDKPCKKRQLSAKPDAVANDNVHSLPSRRRDSLFLFSDDILASDGPNTTKTPFVLDSDPIVFTSSAPEPRRRSPSPKNKQRALSGFFSDDDGDTGNTGNTFGAGGRDKRRSAWEDIIEHSSDFRVPDPSERFDVQESDFAVPALRSELSGRTASLLASLTDRSKSKTGNAARAKSKSRTKPMCEEEDDPDELPEPQGPRGGRKPKKAAASTTQSTADKEARAKEREAAKAERNREKQLEKQIEKERKQKEKEEKAKEKQFAADITQANKLKLDKKTSTPEMILDLPSSLKETSIGNQVVELMRLLGVEHSFFNSQVSNVVKWRRKVQAKYNETLGYWEPCALQVRDEDHILCIVTAQEFVDMVTSSLASDSPDAPNELELHVLRLKRLYPRCTIIYLIEGLTIWMRKNTTSRNRAYQAEFLRHLDPNQHSAPTSTARRKKTNKCDTPPVDDDTIEDALLNLQVTHRCLIHQSAAPAESADWIKIFTEHISTIPYRRERMEDNTAAFCMDGGQVKAGENAPDTYIRMLQEINRITGSMAYGIANEYPSVVDLVKGMRRTGPGMLEDVKKSANKNGAITDSRIGPAASRRLYKVFMGLDPDSTDV
ncbi:ERCC4 domain-containing protein [Aspergillus californicus]